MDALNTSPAWHLGSRESVFQLHGQKRSGGEGEGVGHGPERQAGSLLRIGCGGGKRAVAG